MLRRFQRGHQFGLEQLEKREMLSIGTTSLFLPGARGAAVSDDYGNTFALAAQVSVSTTGSATQSGTIGVTGDVDVFKVVATVTGKMTIQELAGPGSRLDSYLYVYDANQKLIAQNDDYGRTLNSQVVINVTAGATYCIKASAYGRSTGAYTIQCATTAATTTPTDDYGNTIAAATAITLSTTGSAAKSGKIETSSDVDMFKIVATVTGTMTIQQAAASGSQLNSYLYAYDSTGTLLAENNNNGSSLNSQVQISVVAGATYYVKAAAYQTSTGAYSLSFSTTAETTSTPTESGFQITATVTGMTTAAQAIIQQAIDRWEEIIVGDLSDVTYNGRVVDDIEIAISGITIDGSGNVLGQSTATAFRSDSDLPYMGYIQLDTADVATMLSDGSLLGVIEHEIAHVLGFGVIWSDLGLLVGAGTSSPGFTGANAVAAYNAIFGTNVTAVPVEADGGSGTRLSHWEESVFSTELMTGWYNSGQTNALSQITVASMADIGYQVNMAAADSYTRPTSSVLTFTLQAGGVSQAYGNLLAMVVAATSTPSGVNLPTVSVLGSDAIGRSASLLVGANATSSNATEASFDVARHAVSDVNSPVLSAKRIAGSLKGLSADDAVSDKVLKAWHFVDRADAVSRGVLASISDILDTNWNADSTCVDAVDSWFAELADSNTALAVA